MQDVRLVFFLSAVLANLNAFFSHHRQEKKKKEKEKRRFLFLRSVDEEEEKNGGNFIVPFEYLLAPIKEREKREENSNIVFPWSNLIKHDVVLTRFLSLEMNP